MDENQLHSHPQLDPEDLEGILRALEKKSAIKLTVSLPTESILESSKPACTPNQKISRNQPSSTEINTPFFSSLVASTNKSYSFDKQKMLFDGVSYQATVSPDQTFTDRLSCGNEQLWNGLPSDTSYENSYSIISQSIPSFDLPKAELYDDSRYGVLMGEDEIEVAAPAQLSALSILHTELSSTQTKLYYNWKETTDLGSTSNAFQGSMPPAYASTSTPDSFMYPSTSEASDDASNQDDGPAYDKAEENEKGTTLEKQSDETANTAEGKKSTYHSDDQLHASPRSEDKRKVQKKRIKRQRGPRYALRTRSQVEVMDDGYRWRKYGQKAVKNSPHPRSYYRCTNIDCPVKKRVERSAEDAGLVITTYEGVHTHHSPSTLLGSPTAGFPLASFQRPNNSYLHLPLPATPSSALAHLHSRESHLQLPATRGLLEDMLYFRTPRTS